MRVSARQSLSLTFVLLGACSLDWSDGKEHDGQLGDAGDGDHDAGWMDSSQDGGDRHRDAATGDAGDEPAPLGRPARTVGSGRRAQRLGERLERTRERRQYVEERRCALKKQLLKGFLMNLWSTSARKVLRCRLAILMMTGLASTTLLGCTEPKVRGNDGPLAESDMLKYRSCSEDIDCVFVHNGCCTCANGGVEAAVNRTSKDVFEVQFKCPNGCTLMGRIPACGSGQTSCEKGLCTYSLPPADPPVGSTAPSGDQ